MLRGRALFEISLLFVAMASQPVDPSSSFIEILSFIRGYHAYQDIWQPMWAKFCFYRRNPRTSMVVKFEFVKRRNFHFWNLKYMKMMTFSQAVSTYCLHEYLPVVPLTCSLNALALLAE